MKYKIVATIYMAVCWIMMIASFFTHRLMLAGASMALMALGCVLTICRAYWIDRQFRGQKIKMFCICSKEALGKMNGIRGKMITQGGHAYTHASWDSDKRFPHLSRAYRRSGRAYKITLVVPTEDDLKVFEDRYRDICGVSLVKDAGFTVFKNADGTPNPTVTFLGIGPIPESLVGDDIKALKTLT